MARAVCTEPRARHCVPKREQMKNQGVRLSTTKIIIRRKMNAHAFGVLQPGVLAVLVVHTEADGMTAACVHPRVRMCVSCLATWQRSARFSGRTAYAMAWQVVT